MVAIIILFGGLILIAGFLLVINPELIFGFLRNNQNNSVIHLFAVVVRIIMGLLLITQSDLSRFPVPIEVLGWILIAAGVGLAVIGRANFRRLLSWVLEKFGAYGRLAGAASIVFGGALVYAFL